MQLLPDDKIYRYIAAIVNEIEVKKFHIFNLNKIKLFRYHLTQIE